MKYNVAVVVGTRTQHEMIAKVTGPHARKIALDQNDRSDMNDTVMFTFSVSVFGLVFLIEPLLAAPRAQDVVHVLTDVPV